MKIPASKEVIIFDQYLRKLEKHIKNIEYFEISNFLIEKIRIYLENIQFITEVQFESLRYEDFHEINKILTQKLEKKKSSFIVDKR